MLLLQYNVKGVYKSHAGVMVYADARSLSEMNVTVCSLGYGLSRGLYVLLGG